MNYNIKISKRLKSIANLIESRVVVDVGCDTARLAVWLAINKNCLVYAVDEKEGPLLDAKRNVEKFKVSDKVKLLKSSGIKNAFGKFVGASEVVVAGLGGLEIIDIVCGCKDLFNSKIRLILQPQSKVQFFVWRLCLSGFKIEKEVAVVEKGKGYLIFVVRFCGTVTRFKFNRMFVFDRSFFDSADAKAYVAIQKARIESVLNGLKNANSSCKIQRKMAYFENVLVSLNELDHTCGLER